MKISELREYHSDIEEAVGEWQCFVSFFLLSFRAGVSQLLSEKYDEEGSEFHISRITIISLPGTEFAAVTIDS